ncbi:MAG: nitrite reductase, copper-containing, partial [Lutibacter sp.]
MGIVLLLFISCNSTEKEKITDPAKILVHGTMDAELTSPPMVPTPIGDRTAKKLIVKMEILELEGTMTDGVKYVYWT